MKIVTSIIDATYIIVFRLALIMCILGGIIEIIM